MGALGARTERMPWWRRLATSTPLEMAFFFLVLLACLGWLLSLLGALRFGPFPLDQQVASALLFSVLGLAGCWIATLRIAFPLLRESRWRRVWHRTPHGVWYWAGYQSIGAGIFCTWVLPLFLGPGSLGWMLAAALIAGIAGGGMMLVGHRSRVVTAHPRLATSLAVALLVFTVLLVGWYVYQAPTLFPDYTLGPVPSVRAMAWSPDGHALAVMSFSTPLTIWSAETHQLTRQLPCTSDSPGPLAWSADGRYLAAGCEQEGAMSGSRATVVWDVARGSTVSTFSGTDAASELSWSPTGDVVALIEGNYPAANVVVYDVARHAQVSSFALVGGGDQVTWSPDGRYLGVIDSAGVRVLNATTGTVARTLAPPAEGILRNSIAWSRDGTDLFVSSSIATSDNGTYHWRLEVSDWSVLTGERLSSVMLPDSIFAVSWSPDGQAFVVEEEGIPAVAQVYSSRTGHILFTWRGQSGAEVFAWSADGRTVASVGFNDHIAVWQPVL